MPLFPFNGLPPNQSSTNNFQIRLETTSIWTFENDFLTLPESPLAPLPAMMSSKLLCAERNTRKWLDGNF
jgi:hypothetical protein